MAQYDEKKKKNINKLFKIDENKFSKKVAPLKLHESIMKYSSF
jgi:hypothetical protein